MQCEVFETRLNQLLDRRERPETDDYLQAHAAGCESCRELLAVQELLFDGLELLEQPRPTPEFARRVVASAAVERRSVFSSPRWFVLAASIAAVLVVGVFVGPRLFLTQDPDVAGPTKPASDKSGASVGSALVNPGRVPRKTETGAEPRPASAPSKDNALAGNDYRQVLEQFPRRLPGALETVEQIPGGLKPITTSFGVAVGLIRNTLPRGKDETPPPKPQAAYSLGQGFIV